MDTARVFAGGLDESREAVLEHLCAAAERTLCGRLREDVRPEDCHDAFVCAAAWIALSSLSAAKGSDGVDSFTAGTLTVHRATGAEHCLAMQAEVMMAPYLRDGSFRFQGV